MEYVTLGRTGLKVSRLAIGTNALSRKYDPDVTPQVFNWLLDQGLNYIGTGNMYGDCQTYLRRAIMHRRDEFYLSGKGGIVPARDILLGIEAGLYWLGTDHFDVWEMDFIRSMDAYDVAFGPGGTLEGIKKAQEQGKVRFIGVTSHCPDYVNAFIDTGEVDTAMFFANPVFPYGVREILPHARAHGVGTLGMRPTDQVQIRPIDKSLLWALHSGIDVAISGMYTMQEAQENVAVANAQPRADELQALRDAFAAVPEHGCHNCFACKCPFNIPVQRFATYLNWRAAFGLADELEAALRKEARRAADFVAFCERCGLCEAQCSYGVPLVSFVKRAVCELAG
jgi:uncharacterized protein